MRTSSLHFCTSDSWGGLELYACTLMSELKKAGTSVSAICKHGSKIEEFLKAHDIQYAHLPVHSPLSLNSVRFVRSLIDRHRIDCVHVHYHSDIWTASLSLRGDKERKLFLSVYMGVGRKKDIWHRFIYRRLDGLFTSSPEFNRRLPQLYPVSKEKIHLLPYGRLLGLYVADDAKRRAVRSQLGLSPQQFLVGSLGRIDPGKGVMEFMESFLYLEQHLQENVKYLIVGEPTRRGNAKPGESPYEPHCEEYFRQLQKFVAEHNLNEKMHFAGFQEDVIGYLSAMDVFIFPSRDELYSLAMLDAMAMGLPIVAAGASGNLLQIRDGENGLLFKVADGRDLAEKLSTYLASQELRKKHGIAARRFVEENHDMKEIIARLLRFYQES